jgi:ion channel
MDRILPVGEVALGASLLVVSLLIHGVGMYFVQRRFDRRPARLSPSRLARQYFFGTLIVLMLATHLVEAIVWAAALVILDAVPSFRDAYYYVTATYTALGYGEGTLSREWRILAPMIAMSGLFAFGWTTGVLVNIVHRAHSEL